MGQDTGNSETLASLLTVGRRALRRILLLDDFEQREQRASLLRRLRWVAVSFLHKQVLSTLLGFFVRVLTGWRGHVGVNLEALRHVFDLSQEQKDLLRTLIPFLDPNEPGLAERLEDMIHVQGWSDPIGGAVVDWALLGHGIVDFDMTLPVLKEMIDVALGRIPPRLWVLGLLWVMCNIAQRQDSSHAEIRKLVEKGVLAIQEDSRKWVELARAERPVPYRSDCRTNGLAYLIGVTYASQGNVESAILRDCLEKAITARDAEYLELYVTHEITKVFESGQYWAALRALQPIVVYDSPEVREAVVALLVRVRRYDLETVEDLLLQSEFPPEIVTRVLAYPSSERLNDLMTWQVNSIMTDLFLLGPKLLRLELQWFISQALRLSKIQDWLVLIVKELLNLLAGELVFEVPDDAPSRQLLWIAPDEP